MNTSKLLTFQDSEIVNLEVLSSRGGAADAEECKKTKSSVVGGKKTKDDKQGHDADLVGNQSL